MCTTGWTNYANEPSSAATNQREVPMLTLQLGLRPLRSTVDVVLPINANDYMRVVIETTKLAVREIIIGKMLIKIFRRVKLY